MKLTKTDRTFVLEGECQCDTCKGSGLYQGMCEKDGAAVTCNRCDGTGKIQIKSSYVKFTSRKIKKNVNRVYDDSMGYVITDHDVTQHGVHYPFGQYGCAYEDWLKGAKPIPLKFLGCPMIHDQCEARKKIKRCDDKNWGGKISDCQHYQDKAKCWEIYEGGK